MNYNLDSSQRSDKNTWASVHSLTPLLSPEKKRMFFALGALILNSICNLVAPFLFGYAIDTYIQRGVYMGAVYTALVLFVLYIIALLTSYTQTQLMGTVGQNVLFRLRNQLFAKIQELPISFFHQNKAGDLISRVNNDTDKLNQFFSQSLVQFFNNIFMMAGAAAFLIWINPTLGLASLAPTLIVVLLTQALSPLLKKKNEASLRSTGALSSEMQESLANFKVIIAFNRRDYFRDRFDEVNQENYKASLQAGMLNQVFTPLYGLAYNIAQIIVLTYGIYQIMQGDFTVGLLISFFGYINNFYQPLRFMAALWTAFQVALASWDRVSDILNLQTNLTVLTEQNTSSTSHLLEWDHVTFQYEEHSTPVLQDISLQLDSGKTYALVGPTGGGKTTTASLMARLFDPTTGTIYLHGKDIRTYSSKERTQEIGFILQEPYLFAGTIGENITYGLPKDQAMNEEKLHVALKDMGVDALIEKFPEGLQTKVSLSGESLSLGQKQLIAFIRAVLRKPSLLILDEATANVDTVTEQLLESILENLPAHTTKVIIAHRLNTIENADEIFFVHGGTLSRATSMEDAVNMLLHKKRTS